MIQDFIYELLNSLVNLFKEHGIAKILGYLLILGCVGYTAFAMFNIDNIIQTAIIKSDKIEDEWHNEAVKRRREITPKINVALSELMYKYGADRVAIVEMHNGTNNTAGLPFIYGEMTYEQVRDGVIHVDGDYTKINLTRFTIPLYMAKHNFFCGSVDDMAKIDEKFASRIVSDGTYYITGFMLYGSSVEIGYLIMAWGENHPEKTDVMLSDCSMVAQKIAIWLDSTRKKYDSKI